MAERPQILVVEDEQIVAEHIQVTLEGADFHVPAAVASGSEAVRAASEHRPDLMLVDIHLPGEMDGIETAATIRRDFDIPVVFLTAHGDNETIARAKQVEPLGFLLKPFQERELCSAVEVALYKHQMDRELRRRERLLNATLRGIADGVIAVDGAGNVLLLNTAAEELLGIPAAAAEGRRLSEVLVTSPELRVAEGTGGDDPKAAVLTTASGIELPIEYTHLLIQTDADEAVSSVVLFRDTALRRRAAEAEALRRSEEKIRALLEHGSDMVGVVSAEGIVRYSSPSTEGLLGYTAAETRGIDVLSIVHEDARDDARKRLEQVAAESGARASTEITVLRRDGSSVMLEVVATNALDNPLIDGIIINARDITVRRQTEQSLRRSEAKHRQLFETMAQGVVYQMADGSISSVNPAAERILGLSLDQMQGRTSTDPRWRSIREDGSDFPGEEHPSMEALRTGKPVTDVLMGVYHPQEDRCRWISITAIPEFRNGETSPYRVYATFSDITARKEAEAQLVHAASFDPLTDLANRSLLIDRLRHVIVRSKRRPTALYSVLFLDLDRFKNVNDSLGHHAGDELLVECARRLSRCLRAEDTAARFGGDEFVILLEEIADISEATRVAERIQAELRPAIKLKGRDVFITASIGIVVRPSAEVEAETILRDADLAMYRAKEKGRARWELYDVSMHERVLARQVLESDLHHALRREQFSLCFQPIVDIDTGRVRCFEALPRWLHPELGTLSPTEFLAAAEEIDLLVPIERWCLRQACGQLSSWSQSGAVENGTAVSVNISRDLLTSPALIPELEEILGEACLVPALLKLEIGGTAITTDIGSMEPVLAALRSLGVGLHVDDFGTSLASVDALIRFSFERIKVSQSLIGKLSGQVGGEIMQTMIAMARNLGLGTIVKGIETEEQAAYLDLIGCDQAQGRYFAEPMPADEIVEHLKKS